jgi:cobalamin transport system ATP-binding protein
VLETRNITVTYGQREAVVDISLRVDPGDLIAIIGANGAGKSSLLRALNGALQPAAGEVLLHGRPLHSYARRTIGKHIAVVAQETLLAFPVSVFEYVLGGRYPWSATWGWESQQDLEVVHEVLRETELEEFSDRLMNELSGGERQRAVLARALATQAELMLLDEPTANLDLAHQASMLQLIRTQCETRAWAAVVVTHDINLAAEVANRALLLRHGRLIAIGAPQDVLTKDFLREVLGIEVLVDTHPLSGVPRITPAHQPRR